MTNSQTGDLGDNRVALGSHLYEPCPVRARSQPTYDGPKNDRTLGIRTSRSETLDGLTIDSQNRKHAERYEPTPVGILDDMLLGLDLDYERTTFIDLGAGKGRIVCQAACHPFRRVVGVEFAAELVAAAQANLERLTKPHVRAREVCMIHQDAARHAFPPGPKVVYMYNPFRAPVLEAVLRNLYSAYETDRAPTFILYFEPVCRPVLDLHPNVKLRLETKRWAIFALDHDPA